MKSLKNLSAMLVATLLVVVTGCAGRITPQRASTLTMAAVYAAGRGNPKSVKQMRELQPKACAIAATNASVLEVATAVANLSSNPDVKVGVTAVLSILQTATAPQGTNTVNAGPYFQAVLCDGWQAGLAFFPDETGGAVGVTRRNLPPEMKKPPLRFVVAK